MELVKAYEDSKKTLKNPTKQDYKTCYESVKNAFIKLHGVDAIALDEHHAISFSAYTPSEYVLYEPFYKFYLLYSDESLSHAELGNDKNLSKQSPLGSVSSFGVHFGKFDSFLGKNLARVKFKSPKNSIVLNPCCDMLGLGLGEDKFILNSYLEYLMKRKSPIDGYVGLSFKQIGSKVLVGELDLLLENQAFCPDDEIIEVGSKSINSKDELERLVLFAQKDEPLSFRIKRKGKEKLIKALVVSKPSYDINSLSYLEKIGIYLNEDLIVTMVKQDSLAHKKGIKIGDKLLEMSFSKLDAKKDIREKMAYKKGDDFSLLFTRNDFQFFINFSRKEIKGGFVGIAHCR